MEAVIYDDFDLYSPFDFDAPSDLAAILPSQSAQAANALDFESLFASPPSTSPHANVLPADSHTRDMEYSFGVQCVHEFDLWNGRFAHFTRQSRLRFAPRKLFHAMKLTSPVTSLLGTNIYPSVVDVPLVRQLLSDLEAHCQVLEDHLFLLGLVMRQLSKERWCLANHIDLHTSLLVTLEQRVGLILRKFSTPGPPCDIQITDITFEFMPEDINVPICLAAEPPAYTIRFPLLQPFDLSPTRANQLLAAGKYPSTEEVHTMQEMLQAVEPTYRMVSQNARALQGIVDNLGKQLDSVRQHMYLHSALLAPANRCPIEILHEIFKLYFQEYDTSSDTPFVLAAVSTYWRQVIISLPWLWAKVQIQVDIQTFSPRVIEGLSTWLGRAGSTYPLSLRIVFVRKCTINWRSRDDSDWLTEDILENRDASFLFDILRRYSLRWHKLEFIRCPPNVLQVLSGVMGDSVPNLRSLMIDGLEWTASFTHELPHSFPKWLLPKGSHLSLSRDRFLSLHMTSVFQLSNVRSLTLADCTSIMNNRLLLSEFLSHCTSLETCKLRCTAKLDHGTVTLFRTLPSLLDLSVEMETPDKMLHFMILPRLRRLKLSFLERAYFSSNLRFVQELFGRSRLVHLSGSFNPSPDGVYEFSTIPSTMVLKGK